MIDCNVPSKIGGLLEAKLYLPISKFGFIFNSFNFRKLGLIVDTYSLNLGLN